MAAILRRLLEASAAVVYRADPSAATVVQRAAAALKSGSERVMIRPYPPPTFAALA